MKIARAALLLALALSACSKKPDTTPDAGPPVGGDPLAGGDCDPLVPSQCGFPFPSNVYLVDDPSTVTHKRVQFRPTTLPLFKRKHIRPDSWNHQDGFSPGQAALTHLPGATTTGLPTPNTIELSLTDASPTVLVEVHADGSVRRVPHWAELDQSTLAPPEAQTFIIRPVERLKDATRYIVAIRHVVDASGQALAPSPVFKALRDGSDSADPTVAPRRALYSELFAKLAEAGVARDDLQLAWDYSTASRENNTSDVLSMRDQALALVGAAGPEYTVTAVTENPNQYIARRIEGTFKAPLFLETDQPGSTIHRGPDGKPAQNTVLGTMDFAFLVQIPKSVAADGLPAPIVQQGHGLLGSRDEGRDGYFARLANDGHYVTLAVNLFGFDGAAINVALKAITDDPTAFVGFIDSQQQGLVNELVAMRMLMGRFTQDPNVQYGGHSVIDPTRRYYRGDSQGGIMGTSYMAITTDVTRGYLGEPGLPYNLLLNRSHDFDTFWTFMLEGFSAPATPDPAAADYQHWLRDPQLMLALMQMLWDRSEPDGYAPYITHDMLPGTPRHAVMINDGIGDFQVTPLGAHILARAVGAKNLKPVNRHLFGIEEADGPLADGESAITEYNFQLDQNVDMTLPLTNVPPTLGPAGQYEGPDGGIHVSCDPHDKVRQEAPVFMQTEEFFRSGRILNFCTGQSLRPPGADKPGSCQFDWSIPYEPAAQPAACSPG